MESGPFKAKYGALIVIIKHYESHLLFPCKISEKDRLHSTHYVILGLGLIDQLTLKYSVT